MNITVFLGGPSREREVSLKSGAAVMKALRQLGHQVTALDPVHPDWRVPDGTEVVFLALHGTYGEDGTVQAALDALGVPYTGSDAPSSRLAFDKVASKRRLMALGVPTPRSGTLRGSQLALPEGWQVPVVLKPVRQGSSVGLHFVERPENFASALEEVLHFDSEALLEEMVGGREVTVGILEGKALPLVEIRPKQGGYNYQNKYCAGATNYLCPAPFPAEVTQSVQAAGLKAFEAVGGRDYGRVDVIIRASGEPAVLEVNTLPGMTATSLLPMAAAAAGFSFEALCQRMVELARRRAPATKAEPVRSGKLD